MQDELQTAAEAGQVITGIRETVKHAADLSQIVIAANTPAELRERVQDAADEHDIPVDELDIDNRELGALCMKPYTASVVGITD